MTDSARSFIARRGFDPVYGARPLKRFLQHEVETRIGRALIAGDILDGAALTLDVEGEALSIRHRNPDSPEEAAAEPEVIDATVVEG